MERSDLMLKPARRRPIQCLPAKALLLLSFFVLGFVLSTGGVGGQAGDDHGDTIGTATSLTLGSSVEGRIDPGEDLDVFKVDLSGESAGTDVWIYATGDLDSFGELLTSTGTVIVSNDYSYIHGRRTAFHIRWMLSPQVYYVRVSASQEESDGERPIGEYTLHAEAVTDYPGGTAATAELLELGPPTPGMVETASDANYFRLDLAESTNLFIYALTLDLFDENDEVLPEERIDAEVLDSEGVGIPVNVHWDSLGFHIIDDLGPGTHFIKITTPDYVTTHPVPYTIHAYVDTEYSIFIEDCEAATQALTASQTGDPLYGCQWHLNNREGEDINVEAVWAEGITGRGVNVAVVDDGMDHRHEDLRDNVDMSRNHDYTGAGDLHDPYAHHGTNVAGIIAARDNDTGVHGVAPRATIYGYNFLHPDANTDMEMADSMARHRDVTAVSNNSWGPFDGPGLGTAPRIWELAVDSGIKGGYEGRGVFYAFAAGNGHLAGDEANLDENSNYYGVTAVCAVDDGDTRSVYSETGANLWICAPSDGGTRGILTTENSDRYNPQFGGTSAATPIVAGVAVLMREANPDLTWRDLKLILAASARKNDAANPGWEEATHKYRAESDTDRYHFNHEYGFGMVDAKAAVDLAREWNSLPPLESSKAESSDRNLPVPDSPVDGYATTVESTAKVDTRVGFVEFVDVTVTFQHDSIRDLDIELVSPSGAVSQLVGHLDTHDAFGELVPLHGAFRFGSARHLGEDPNGEWRLRVTDHIPTIEGSLESWSVTVYGHASTPGRPVIDWVTTDDGSLTVGWGAPQETGGAPVTGYDLRYIASYSDEAVNSSWTVVEDVWTANGGEKLEYTLTGLKAGSRYDVQLRAVNENGVSLWSETFSAAAAASACAAEGTVPGASSNPGLVSDCRVLMEARDALAPGGSLDWDPNTPITTWRGITAKGAPKRIVALSLQEEGLTGTIPAEMKGLVRLTELDLSQNGLTGTITPDLGGLLELTELDLSQNGLTGTIPAELGSLVELTELDLSQNGLTGTIPAELGSLVELTELNLSQNGLTGTIPAVLGRLASLALLSLKDNELGGPIPGQLQGLINLRSLFLAGNSFSGCIPAKLQELKEHDLDQLDIRYCDDRSILVELYHATEGGNWQNNTNWLSDEPIGEWHGVTTDDEGRVIRLNLDKHQLSGEIPTGLGSLSNLQQLSLWGNELSGEIPTALGNLSNLQELYLFNNQLAGGIPTQLGNLSNLVWLDLGNNQLGGGIPAQLGNLSSLQFLSLQNDQLTGEIPKELGNLSNLQQLYLNHNDLEGSIPASLGRLSDLRYLHLSNNRLTGCVPPRLRDVPNNDFDQLGLPFCPVSPPEAPTIDSVMSAMESLTVSWSAPLNDGGSDITAYDLRYIETDEDETVDSTWTAVEDVWITGGGLLQYTLAGLTGGTQYDIQVRAVNDAGDGSWSDTVTGTPIMATTMASACVTEGAVTDATNTGLISDCDALLAARDALAGSGATRSLNWEAGTSISQWYGVVLSDTTPQRVTQLRLHGQSANADRGTAEAKLNGTIPPELGHLSELEILYLHRNNLRGEIPGALNSLSKLRLLYLYDNELTSISDELGSGMSSLRRLFAQRNRIDGAIPAGLGDMPRLDWLRLERNRLTGQIPDRLGNLTTLRRLYLHENRHDGSGRAGLSGGIPSTFSGLTNLEYLVVHRNSLSGTIPGDLGSLSNMRWLSLYDNGFNGPIPAELGGLANLERLYLHGNELSGTIPSELGGLESLTNLWLRDNDLSGQIPQSLGELPNLERVRISGNDFTGCIPAGLLDVEGRTSDAESLGLQVCGESTSTVPAPTGVERDRAALVALYHATNGPDWWNSKGWLSNAPLDQWQGVTVDDHTGRVVGLDLKTNNCKGELPLEFGDLTALEELDLSSNEISDVSSLSNLTGLRSLDLGSNSISDISPLANLTNLRRLGLVANEVTDISTLSTLNQLEWLNLLSANISDVSPLLGLPSLQFVNLLNNPLSWPSVYEHIPVLQARGVSVNYHAVAFTGGGFTVEDGPQIHNDNLFVLPVEFGELEEFSPLPKDFGPSFQTFASSFYKYFEDEFDFLIFVTPRKSLLGTSYGGFFVEVQNHVQGIGIDIFSHSQSFGSAGRLQGVCIITSPLDFRRPIIHELMHRWGAYMPALSDRSHWAPVSNVHGVLGNGLTVPVAVDELVKISEDTYLTGITNRPAFVRQYNSLELYVAGFIPPDEVSDVFWVASDGRWVDRPSEFTASEIREYTIDDIIAAYGKRLPEAAHAQRDFRAAAVLLIDKDNPASADILNLLSREVTWLSLPGIVEGYHANFYDATGGRATLTMDGLSKLQKSPQEQ